MAELFENKTSAAFVNNKGRGLSSPQERTVSRKELGK
jgi:hypothetical protein